MNCPCCGAKMKGSASLDALAYLPLPRLTKRTLDVLIEAYPRALTCRRIADLVYGDDPSGGPDTAENAVSVYMSRMRPKLKKVGWSVGFDSSASGIRLSPVAARATA